MFVEATGVEPASFGKWDNTPPPIASSRQCLIPVFTTLYSGGFLYSLIYSLTTSSPHNVMQ